MIKQATPCEKHWVQVRNGQCAICGTQVVGNKQHDGGSGFSLQVWMDRAKDVDNGDRFMPGAFFVVDYGQPWVEVYTHKGLEGGEYERVGYPVMFGTRQPEHMQTLEQAAQRAALEAENSLRAQGRWPEQGTEHSEATEESADAKWQRWADQCFARSMAIVELNKNKNAHLTEASLAIDRAGRHLLAAIGAPGFP